MGMDEFDMVEIYDKPMEVAVLDKKSSGAPSVGEHLGHAVADNLDRIIGIANNIVEIKKMQVQSDAVIKQINAETERLRVEADNYVKMKGADTKDAVDRIDALRRMINDINASPNNKVSSSDLNDLLRTILEKR